MYIWEGRIDVVTIDGDNCKGRTTVYRGHVGNLLSLAFEITLGDVRGIDPEKILCQFTLRWNSIFVYCWDAMVELTQTVIEK